MEFYHLSSKTLTVNEKPTTHSARLRALALTRASLKIRNKNEDIDADNHFCATFCPSQYAGRHCHSDYIKVSKVSATPQTHNLHERPSAGQSLETTFFLSRRFMTLLSSFTQVQFLFLNHSGVRIFFKIHIRNLFVIALVFVPQSESTTRSRVDPEERFGSSRIGLEKDKFTI